MTKIELILQVFRLYFYIAKIFSVFLVNVVICAKYAHEIRSNATDFVIFKPTGGTVAVL